VPHLIERAPNLLALFVTAYLAYAGARDPILAGYVREAAAAGLVGGGGCSGIKGCSITHGAGRCDCLRNLILNRSIRRCVAGAPVALPRLAATNKYLAQNNNSGAEGKATKKREIRQPGLIRQ
jgi:hypothetical protein